MSTFEPLTATKSTTRLRKSTHGAYAPSALRACPEGAVVIQPNLSLS